MGVIGKPANVFEKTTLFEGVVNTTVSVYLKFNETEFERTPEKTLVTLAPSVTAIVCVPSDGVSTVGVPDKSRMPSDGEFGYI